MTKLNSTGSALVFSTCLGGNGDDGAMAIALDGSNYIWVTGASESNNFPTTADAYHVATGQAAFLANLNSTGTKLLFSSFVSNGGEFDQGMGVALDTNGNVYAVGRRATCQFFPLPRVSTVSGGALAHVSVIGMFQQLTGCSVIACGMRHDFC